METSVVTPRTVRFGAFEADLSSGLLTRHGLRVKIEVQPFQVLTLLLTHPREVITREQIRRELWPNGINVDFDGSLNAALKKLRAALNDDPKKPRYIETIPKRGYRFIFPITAVSAGATAMNTDAPAHDPAFPTPVPRPRGWRDRLYGTWSFERVGALATLVFVTALVLLGIAKTQSLVRLEPVQASSHPAPPRPSVAVLGFRNVSGRPGDAWLSTAFSEMLSTELAGGEMLRVVPGGDIANLRQSMPWPEAGSLDPKTAARIGYALDSDILVLGSFATVGAGRRTQLRIDARLQDARTGRILTESAASGDEEALFEVVAQLGGKLRKGLGIPGLAESEAVGMMASLPLDPETARFYALGLDKLRAFDAAAAKDLFEQAVEADPKFALAHAMLARAWGALGYDQSRKEECRKALDLSTDLPRASRMMIEGDYYESLGRHEKAASVYHTLFESYPDNLDYGLQLAQLEFESSGPDPALETMRQLRRLPPPVSDNPDLDLHEADIQVYKDVTAADRLYRSAAMKALAQGRKLAYASAERGVCYLNLKHLPSPPECQVAYEIYMAAGNRDAAGGCLQVMAETNRLTGHELEAIPFYERAERLFAEVGDRKNAGAALNNLSLVYEEEGRWRQAEETFREAKEDFQAVNHKWGAAATIANIADILVYRGHLQQAAAMYRQAMEIDDSIGRSLDSYASIEYASLLLTQGRLLEARQEAEAQVNSQRIYAQDLWQLANALSVLGDVEKASGDFTSARKSYQEELETLKKVNCSIPAAAAQVSLAELATDEGHPNEAVGLLRPAIAEFEKEQSAGDEIGGYAALARAALAQGDAATAREAITRAGQCADLREFPLLSLPLKILQARTAAMGVEPGHIGDRTVVMARETLRGAINQSHQLGLYGIECQARLALGELEMKLDPASGHSLLGDLAADAHSHGMKLVSLEAVELQNSPASASRSLPDALRAYAAHP